MSTYAKLGLLHPNHITGRAPVVPVEEINPVAGDVEIAAVGEIGEQEAVGGEREGEEEEAEGEESSGSEADSDPQHIEEGPEVSPPTRNDILPTPVPSPFIDDQGAKDETETQLEEGDIQGEKDMPGSSGAAEPPKKKFRIIHSGAAAPTSLSQAPSSTEVELFQGLDDIPLPDSATMAEIISYSLGLAASKF